LTIRQRIERHAVTTNGHFAREAVTVVEHITELAILIDVVLGSDRTLQLYLVAKDIELFGHRRIGWIQDHALHLALQNLFCVHIAARLAIQILLLEDLLVIARHIDRVVTDARHRIKHQALLAHKVLLFARCTHMVCITIAGVDTSKSAHTLGRSVRCLDYQRVQLDKLAQVFGVNAPVEGLALTVG